MAKKTAKKAAKKSAPKKSARREDDYNNEMRGVLFKNKRKKKESQPDLTGSAEIDGVEYWVSAWNNESKQGQKFLSLAFTAKEEIEDEDDEDDEDEDDGDDLPF